MSKIIYTLSNREMELIERHLKHLEDCANLIAISGSTNHDKDFVVERIRANVNAVRVILKEE